MKKEKQTIIAVPSENVEYVESLRIYNVKIPQDFISKERIEEAIEKMKLVIGGNYSEVKRGYNEAISDLRRELLEDKQK